MPGRILLKMSPEIHRPSGGSVEVITGSMFCGKTDELIRRLRKLKVAKKEIQVFKPKIDTRYNPEKVTSHAGSEYEATLVGNANEILEKVNPNTEVVGIDEAQFLDDGIVGVVNQIAGRGIRVIITGLDTDFKGEPFGSMPSLIAQAEIVNKLTAICMVCGEDKATFTQRVIEEEGIRRPANYGDPLVLVGGVEAYEARCRAHHEVPGKPANY